LGFHAVAHAGQVWAIVVNHLHSHRLAALADVGVDYGSDLRPVERVVVDVGLDVMREAADGAPGSSRSFAIARSATRASRSP
jgi:hypothetical protein